MKHFLIFLTALLALASCSKDETDNSGDGKDTGSRTVIVYMSAENNLGSNYYYGSDLAEMEKGVKNIADSDNLLVFVDRPDAKEMPFIARITKDDEHPLDTLFRYSDDTYASDPARFKDVLKKAASLAPASEYALVLWGHASGWLYEKNNFDTQQTANSQRRAYGRDDGSNEASSSNTGKWMNIPTMRNALEELQRDNPLLHWKYIFCDCCNMMCTEVAYELRNVTDYLIGSPAEIPGRGAPYKEVMAGLFSRSSDFYRTIIDDYASEYPGSLPLSAVKTSAMDDLADATSSLLMNIGHTPGNERDMQDMIYYSGSGTSYKVLYDMHQFIKKYTPEEDFGLWKEHFFDKAVVYKVFSRSWATINNLQFSDFSQVPEEDYGGLSMFVPLKAYDTRSTKDNEHAPMMEWYQAVGWSELGW